jgi:hypothetical protein
VRVWESLEHDAAVYATHEWIGHVTLTSSSGDPSPTGPDA